MMVPARWNRKSRRAIFNMPSVLATHAPDPGSSKLVIADKPLLRFITCGSVDDGKSTLIGRLLFDADLAPDDLIAAAMRSSGARSASKRSRPMSVDLPSSTEPQVMNRSNGLSAMTSFDDPGSGACVARTLGILKIALLLFLFHRAGTIMINQAALSF